jgi:hypothetical protein
MTDDRKISAPTRRMEKILDAPFVPREQRTSTVREDVERLSFQDRVRPWMMACFGPEISADRMERNHRFFEEAGELVQSLGMTEDEAHQLVSYTWGRPAGEPFQESGGVSVTHAALCLAAGIDQDEAAEAELARIWTKVEQIRAKQAAKPKHSPLPASPSPIGDDGVERALDAALAEICVVMAFCGRGPGGTNNADPAKWAEMCSQLGDRLAPVERQVRAAIAALASHPKPSVQEEVVDKAALAWERYPDVSIRDISRREAFCEGFRAALTRIGEVDGG